MGEKITGRIDNIENIKELTSGKGKKGPWTLYGTRITIDGDDYSMTAFSSKELKAALDNIAIDDNIECEVFENDRGYMNIEAKSIKVLEKTARKEIVPEKPSAPLEKPQPIKADEIPLEMMAKTVIDLVERIYSEDPATLQARIMICAAFIQAEYAWRTSKFIQKSNEFLESIKQSHKESNMKNFRGR